MAKEYLQDQDSILPPHNNIKIALRIIIIYQIIRLKHDYHKEWKYSFKLKEVFKFEDLPFKSP